MAYYTTHTYQRNSLGFRGFYLRRGKRVLDVALVLGFAPLWIPLVAVLWLLAWLESGSGSYIDKRVGRYGRVFQCLKIRTMRPNSARGCAAYKQVHDPRITWLGRVLRRTSLDELPQLWCVLRGEMSLVGPRPIPSAELQKYGVHKYAYLQMRPGLSGLWQVSGRNALRYDARVALDVDYNRTASLWLDLRIMGATVFEVLRLNGR